MDPALRLPHPARAQDRAPARGPPVRERARPRRPFRRPSEGHAGPLSRACPRTPVTRWRGGRCRPSAGWSPSSLARRAPRRRALLRRPAPDVARGQPGRGRVAGQPARPHVAPRATPTSSSGRPASIRVGARLARGRGRGRSHRRRRTRPWTPCRGLMRLQRDDPHLGLAGLAVYFSVLLGARPLRLPALPPRAAHRRPHLAPRRTAPLAVPARPRRGERGAHGPERLPGPALPSRLQPGRDGALLHGDGAALDAHPARPLPRRRLGGHGLRALRAHRAHGLPRDPGDRALPLAAGRRGPSACPCPPRSTAPCASCSRRRSARALVQTQERILGL